MKFWVVLAFVVLLSSCQIFFLAGVYEELQDKYGIVYIYVSRNGNDANDGLSVSTPVKSLPRAMDIAGGIEGNKRVEVRVEVGVYSKGDGLSSPNVPNAGFVIIRPNITISGGWDSSFSSVVGKSVLDGNNSLLHIIEISGVTNVVLRNIQITRGNANGSNEPVDRGGGIYVKNVSYLVIESNVIVSDNFATSGGGLFLWGLTNSTISCDILSNRATWGGGINLQNSLYNTISGSVYSNSANQYGGGMFLGYSTYTTISGSVYGNYASTYGGGVYLDNSDYFTNTGWITNNTAGTMYGGGGVYKFGSYDNSYFGNVTNNSYEDIFP